jgi:hypothetical protein
LSISREILPSGTVSYVVRYTGTDGHARKAGRFARKTDAEDYERRMRSNVRDGTWLDPAKGRQRLGVYAERVIQTAPLRPTTRASYEQAPEIHHPVPRQPFAPPGSRMLCLPAE